MIVLKFYLIGCILECILFICFKNRAYTNYCHIVEEECIKNPDKYPDLIANKESTLSHLFIVHSIICILSSFIMLASTIGLLLTDVD